MTISSQLRTMRLRTSLLATARTAANRPSPVRSGAATNDLARPDGAVFPAVRDTAAACPARIGPSPATRTPPRP